MALPESTAPLASNLDPEFAQCAVRAVQVLGQIRAVNNLPAYAAAAAVKDDLGNAIGFLSGGGACRRQRVSASSFAELLGSEAAVYYGNSQGGVWTDLERIVPMPPVSLGANQESTITRATGIQSWRGDDRLPAHRGRWSSSFPIAYF